MISREDRGEQRGAGGRREGVEGKKSSIPEDISREGDDDELSCISM